MTFELKNVHTAINAEECELFTYGYFANDIASIRQTIQTKKTSMRTVYDKLEGVCDDKFERRFACSCGVFSFFYPTDKAENELRY